MAVWVAGFDVFYALFDLEHDRAHGLRLAAGPVRRDRDLRPPGSATCSRSSSWRLPGRCSPGRPLAGVAAVAGLLLYEHLLVSPKDTSRLDLAFFTMNGVISVTFFAFVLADVVV